MSLRRRLYMMGLVGLAPVLAAGTWNEWSNRTLRETELRASLAEEAVYVASEFQRQLEGIQTLLQTLAVLPVLRGTAPITCDELFDQVRPQNPVLAALGATDRQGNVVCASDRTPGETLPPISDRSHFREAIKTLGPALGGYAYGRRTTQHVIHMAVPYNDREGNLTGVVFAAVSLDVIARRYDHSHWNSARVITVIDAEGTIIMRQPDYQRSVGQKIPADRWAQLRSYRQPGDYDEASSVDGVRRIVGFSPLSAEPVGMFIGIGVDREAAFAPLNKATLRSVLATVTALVLALSVAWIIARNLIGKPWSRTLRSAKLLRDGDLTARVDVIGRGEFADLAIAFNSVADRLVDALARKDLMLRELSHRVMNSLQVINSVLRMQERSACSEEAKAELRSAASRVQAVAMTYRRLHELNGSEAVDIGELTETLSSEIAQSLLPSPEDLDVHTEALLLPAPRAMSFALIANELLTNAAKHRSGVGKILVNLTNRSGTALFSVSNVHAPELGGPPPSGGFGSKMIKAMAADLNGKLHQTAGTSRFQILITFPIDEHPQDPLEATA